MTYTDNPLTLAELQTALAGDLRDPNHKTFTTADLTRFLNDGLAEVNRVYPLEVTDVIDPVEGQTEYATRFTSAYRVEAWNSGDLVAVIPFNDGDNSYAGWELHGTTLALPPSAVSTEILTAYPDLQFRVTGYARRSRMDAGTPSAVTELDTEAELGVRWFAAYRAFTALLSDRSLFGQWQSQSNNTDVSMPMLINLAGTSQQMWQRHKSNIRILRRQPVGPGVVI